MPKMKISKSDRVRQHLIRGRCWDLVRLGSLGASLLLVLWRYLPPRLSPLLELLPIRTIDVFLLVITIMLLALKPWASEVKPPDQSWWSQQCQMLRSSLGMPCYHTHPPIWVAGICGISIIGLLLGSSSTLTVALSLPPNAGNTYWALAGACLAFLASLIAFGLTRSSYVPPRPTGFWKRITSGLSVLAYRNRCIRLLSPVFSLGYLLWGLSQDSPTDSVLWAMACGSLIGVAFPICADWKRERPTSHQRSTGTTHDVLGFKTFPELQAWVNTDKPVEDIQDDAFNHGPIAIRMAKRLRLAKPPSMIVYGDFGTGKSTLGNLVKGELHRSSIRTEFISVNLWPYENSKAAVMGILGSLIGSLSKWTDIAGLRGMPAGYLEAMGAAGSWWNALSKLTSPPGVTDCLRRLDDILLSTGLRYVLWIEDLERFSGIAETALDPWSRWEKIQPLLSLIHQLDETQSITVVLATTDLHLGFDEEKIARFVEEMPELHPEMKANLLCLFREGCRQLCPKVIDPNPGLRMELNQLKDRARTGFTRALMDSSFQPISLAILSLCDTPRSFKMGLRWCLDFWKRYPGEIDFDNLLVATLARMDNARAYQSLLEARNSLMFREGSSNMSPEDTLAEHLKASGLSERKSAAFVAVAKFLFLEERGRGGQTVSRKTLRSQTYWDRLLHEPDLSEDEKDQSILRDLAHGTDEKVLSRLESPELGEALIDFRFTIGRERIARVFLLLVAKRCSERPSEEWITNNDLEGTFTAPGLINFWRICMAMSKDELLSSDDLWPLLRDTIPVIVAANLTLASDIDYLFVVAENDGRFQDVLHTRNGSSQRCKVRALIRRNLFKTFTGDPERLAHALEAQSPPVLAWLTWGLEKIREKEKDISAGKPVFGGKVPFRKETWRPFAETLLKAIPISAKACLPQIAHLVVHSFSGFGGGSYRFDEELADRLFGDVALLRTALAGQKVEEWEKYPQVQELISERNPLRKNRL